MSAPTTIVWFRQDLRLDDNPALRSAVQRDAPVIPVYIWAPHEEGDWPAGAAQRVWLHHSLNALDQSLAKRKSRLIVRHGASLDELQSMINLTGADVVCFNRRYEPAAAKRDKRVVRALKRAGVTVRIFNGSLLHDPDELRTQTDRPYKVFTPFYKAFSKLDLDLTPVDAPTKLPAPTRWPASMKIDDLKLLPKRDWATGILNAWTPGETAAHQRLDAFRDHAINEYDVQRDYPAVDSTSRLSPYLHFGEISPRRIWHRVQRDLDDGRIKRSHTDAERFLAELGWREFGHHVLHHFPRTPTRPLQEKFAHFPWNKDAKALQRWQQGRTGYPYIDAGMRQLWETGWMHNRVRMAVASFLVKDLLIHWLEGAKWFWNTLVDADLANNTLGWQWAGGCGADAAPYFRIFNPVTQGTKFDPDGTYVRTWVSELKHIPDTHIHAPSAAGPELFEDDRSVYPSPIVEHKAARQRALEAFERVKSS